MQFISGNHTENLFQDCAKKKLIYYRGKLPKTLQIMFFTPHNSL